MSRETPLHRSYLQSFRGTFLHGYDPGIKSAGLIFVVRDAASYGRCDPCVPEGLADSHASLSAALVDMEAAGAPELR